MDDLLARHKAELKELLCRVQGMKHAVPKGDKKRKKQVMSEIAVLEAEMEKRHQAELDEIKKMETSAEIAEGLSEKVDEIKSYEPNDNKPRISKAQRRKERKQEEEKGREKRIAQAEIDNQNCDRNVEAEKLTEMVSKLNLCIKEISPDGNCLYNAIADQLNNSSNQHDWKTLRAMTATHLRDNKAEFLPFMIHTATGESYNDDEYFQYCDDVEGTNAWGGHVEIQALSEVLRTPIEVFQADSRLLKVGEQFNADPVRISYHRHAYGLGEHYNSVVSK